jgi:hypothetical protein
MQLLVHDVGFAAFLLLKNMLSAYSIKERMVHNDNKQCTRQNNL